MGADYTYVQRGPGVIEKNKAEKVIGVLEQRRLERPLLGWSHLPKDLAEARNSGVSVPGQRASLEERRVSVQAPGRQRSAWCDSGIAGQQCEGTVVGDVSYFGGCVHHMGFPFLLGKLARP